jgi:heme-degrading monooxygenase HmoA
MASKIDVGGARSIMAGASVTPYKIVTVELKWTEGEQREYLDLWEREQPNLSRRGGGAGSNMVQMPGMRDTRTYRVVSLSISDRGMTRWVERQSVKKNREKEAGVQKCHEEYASINSGKYQGFENTRADPTPKPFETSSRV